MFPLHIGSHLWKDLFPKVKNFYLTLTRPLLRKLRMRWFFDVSKVEESSFLESNLTDPPQIFDAHLLENTNLGPSKHKTLKKIRFDK